MSKTAQERHAEALTQGYKDETCPKCGTVFLAHIHFVRCHSKPCPMVSTTNTKTLLEMMSDENRAALSAAEGRGK